MAQGASTGPPGGEHLGPCSSPAASAGAAGRTAVTPIAPRHRGPTPPELRQLSGAAGHAPVSPASRPFADGSVSSGRPEDKGPAGERSAAARGRCARHRWSWSHHPCLYGTSTDRPATLAGCGAEAHRRRSPRRDDGLQGGLRRLRRVRPRPTRRPPHLPGALRTPAPRAGVGGDRGGGRPVDHRRQGHGSRPQRLQRADARRAAGTLRHRPHPLLDDRRQHLAQRPARVPRGRRRPLRPRPQRQPDQHRDAGRRGGHAAGDDRERQRPHRRAAGPRDRRSRGRTWPARWSRSCRRCRARSRSS